MDAGKGAPAYARKPVNWRINWRIGPFSASRATHYVQLARKDLAC
jgi:hypothetical protein